MKYVKDCYQVVRALPTLGWVEVARRLVEIPAHTLRVYSLHAGPEYGSLVYEKNMQTGKEWRAQ